MDRFMFDDFKNKVNMGNKKKDLDVKALMQQTDLERKKRQLAKLQAESATIVQKHLRRCLTQRSLANQVFGESEGMKVAVNLHQLRKFMDQKPEVRALIAAKGIQKIQGLASVGVQ